MIVSPTIEDTVKNHLSRHKKELITISFFDDTRGLIEETQLRSIIRSLVTKRVLTKIGHGKWRVSQDVRYNTKPKPKVITYHKPNYQEVLQSLRLLWRVD